MLTGTVGEVRALSPTLSFSVQLGRGPLGPTEIRGGPSRQRQWSLARDRIVPLEGTHGRSIGGGCCLTPSNRKPRERCPRDRGGGRAPPRSASLSPCALFLPRLIHSHCSRPHLHHILYPIRKEKGNFDTTVVAFRPPRTGNRCDRGCFSSPLLSPSLPLLSPSLPFSPLHSTPRHSVSRFPHLTPSSAHGLPSGIYIYICIKGTYAIHTCC